MKSLSLITLIVALCATGAQAAPSLKGDITVTNAIVTVGDMFDDPGALAEMALFRAPLPGTTGIVPLSAVQNAASLIGLTGFDNVGYTRVRVARAASPVDAALLGGLISDELTRRGILMPGMSADTHFSADINLNAQLSDKPATLLDLRYMPQNGSFAARFMLAGIDQPLDVSGSIDLLVPAPRLVNSVAAGTILSAADFEVSMIPEATANAGGFADLDQLVGMQINRQSRAGMMLKASDVGQPTVVSRNDLVTVYLRAGAMTLTVKGQALGSASAGEPVDVLNTATKKILHGIARPDGGVEIVTATAVAAL